MPRPDGRRCEVAGCHRVTRDGKPFCSAHVLTHAPYAREAAEGWQAYEREVRALAAGRPVPLDGLVAQDLVANVSGEPMTVVRLARQLGRAPHEPVERLARRMARAGLVSVEEIPYRGAKTLKVYAAESSPRVEPERPPEVESTERPTDRLEAYRADLERRLIPKPKEPPMPMQPNQWTKTSREGLRALCKRYGQKGLARELGVSMSAVRNWMNGQAPNEGTQATMAELLAAMPEPSRAKPPAPERSAKPPAPERSAKPCSVQAPAPERRHADPSRGVPVFWQLRQELELLDRAMAAEVRAFRERLGPRDR